MRVVQPAGNRRRLPRGTGANDEQTAGDLLERGKRSAADLQGG
jgi:hypothetical protein